MQLTKEKINEVINALWGFTFDGVNYFDKEGKIFYTGDHDFTTLKGIFAYEKVRNERDYKSRVLVFSGYPCKKDKEGKSVYLVERLGEWCPLSVAWYYYEQSKEVIDALDVEKLTTSNSNGVIPYRYILKAFCPDYFTDGHRNIKVADDFDMWVRSYTSIYAFNIELDTGSIYAYNDDDDGHLDSVGNQYKGLKAFKEMGFDLSLLKANQ